MYLLNLRWGHHTVMGCLHQSLEKCFWFMLTEDMTKLLKAWNVHSSIQSDELNRSDVFTQTNYGLHTSESPPGYCSVAVVPSLRLLNYKISLWRCPSGGCISMGTFLSVSMLPRNQDLGSSDQGPKTVVRYTDTF